MSDLTDDAPRFAGFEPPAAPSAYRVLARKYRPQSFDDLIGQDAMVRTVSNAFKTGRIPQAWMLTGVRGVGKTTTARILARALNYEPAAGAGGGPSVHMPSLGRHCLPIMESRHVDVLEIDAASHTGVDNIRQITDAVRYAPVQARYRVYIIDEVHMLSSAAFNAFLKTLEEPPPHAKFVFATTEIRKVPVTILSRCQRFDLRRIETTVLAAHLARICEQEGVAADGEALAAIARAAEGSVRDALSILDQAVAHGSGAVRSEAVRDMLGLADRGQVIDLFEAAMRGDVPASFAALRAGWDLGADPGQMLADLAGFTHLVTRIKLVPDAASDPALTEAERVRGADFAKRLSAGTLSRAWQVLIKAVPEVGASPRPVAAAEMTLVRLAYAADLPAPEEALRLLRDGGPTPASLRAAPTLAAGPVASAAPPIPSPPERSMVTAAPHASGRSAALAARPLPEAAPQAGPIALSRFEDAVALAREMRDMRLVSALERDVRIVRFEDGRMDLSLEPAAARTLPQDLARAFTGWTGRTWVVAVSREAGGPTLDEERRRREMERRSDATGHPVVQAVLATFPGAQIVNIVDTGAGEALATPPDGADAPENPDDTAEEPNA